MSKHRMHTEIPNPTCMYLRTRGKCMVSEKNAHHRAPLSDINTWPVFVKLRKRSSTEFHGIAHIIKSPKDMRRGKSHSEIDRHGQFELHAMSDESIGKYERKLYLPVSAVAIFALLTMWACLHSEIYRVLCNKGLNIAEKSRRYARLRPEKASN